MHAKEFWTTFHTFVVNDIFAFETELICYSLLPIMIHLFGVLAIYVKLMVVYLRMQ